MLQRVWIKGNPLALLVKMLWRRVSTFLRKLKLELAYDPAILLVEIYPDKTIIQKDTCTSIFIATLFTTAKTWKQPRCPSTEEWIKDVMPVYSGVLLAIE